MLHLLGCGFSSRITDGRRTQDYEAKECYVPGQSHQSPVFTFALHQASAIFLGVDELESISNIYPPGPNTASAFEHPSGTRSTQAYLTTLGLVHLL